MEASHALCLLWAIFEWVTTSGTLGASFQSSSWSQRLVTLLDLLSITTKAPLSCVGYFKHTHTHTHTQSALTVLGTEGQVGGLDPLCPPSWKVSERSLVLTGWYLTFPLSPPVCVCVVCVCLRMRKVAFECLRVAAVKWIYRFRWHPDACTHKSVSSETTRHFKASLFSLLAVLRAININHKRFNSPCSLCSTLKNQDFKKSLNAHKSPVLCPNVWEST